jgi:hypothetical protein
VDPKILKGVGAKIVVLNFYNQAVKVEEGWVEQEFVLLSIVGLPNGAGLPNEDISYCILIRVHGIQLISQSMFTVIWAKC